MGDFSRLTRRINPLAYAGYVTIYLPVRAAFLSGAYSHMEKRGSDIALRALQRHQGIVCHWDPTFAAYLAKKRAEGKHYNVALSHAAKKLVRLIYALEKSREPYRMAA
jgi:transposase